MPRTLVDTADVAGTGALAFAFGVINNLAGMWELEILPRNEKPQQQAGGLDGVPFNIDLTASDDRKWSWRIFGREPMRVMFRGNPPLAGTIADTGGNPFGASLNLYRHD